MAPDKGNGRVVFIGNIPYGESRTLDSNTPPQELIQSTGVSEEQIEDIFGRQGHVNNFRLVHDKETGKPKGFGFLEFQDPDNAAAAVRNLDNFEIMGRKLRVDWSNDSGGGGGGASGVTAPTHGGNGLVSGSMGGAQSQAPNGMDSSALPPLPPGIETNLTAPDAISQTLSAMPPPQLLDIISQMKGMVSENPAQLTQLFAVAPQLAFATFQALLLLGLTDTNVLNSIVQAAANPQAQSYGQAPQQAPAPAPIPLPMQPQFAPPPNYANYGQPAHVPTPPVQHAPYPPPQPPQPAAQPDQQAVVQQLLAMTREQIFALPPDQRDQLITIRARLGHPVT